MGELAEIGWAPLLKFKAWDSITRLNRNIVCTEKIDGTNAAVGIIKLGPASEGHPDLESPAIKIVEWPEGEKMDGGVKPAVRWAVYAQSRRRVISPWDDNYGFSQWVHQHADTLIRDLGPGLHYGEWWGVGINRGYGMSRRVFSLFNVSKWEVPSEFFSTPDLNTVPVVLRWTFDTEKIREAVGFLREGGSVAAPGYMDPEGIVVFHAASQAMFKVTLDNDEIGKSAAEAAVIAA